MRILILLGLAACGPVQERGATIALFTADITPPLGSALCGGMVKPAERIADPLGARGFVLRGEETVVFVSLDWTELRNDAYEAWREALATAAGTTPARVLVHCVHQHDAPYADLEAQRLLDGVGLKGFHIDPAFHAKAVGNVVAALRSAEPRRVTHVGMGEADVEGVASNRRVVVDGKATFKRYSRTSNPAIKNAPEGLIDPKLKTLSFWDGERPLAALSLYATHPMSHYGGGSVSADFPGLARAARQAATPDVLQLYASGCAGDVTAAKFNNGDEASRKRLADTLKLAMERAWAATRRAPIGRIATRVAALRFELPAIPPLDPKASNAKKLDQALGLSFAKRIERPIDVPALDLGPARLLLLPGEAFVEFQLEAQRLRPDLFVAVAGYGECGPGYIPTESARAEGYVEEHGYCWVAPGAEAKLKAALQEVLKP